MPQERLSMRKIKEILRLKHVRGFSNRQIAKSCSIGRTTVANYPIKAQGAGISWPLPEDLTEAELQKRLFPSNKSLHNPALPLKPSWDLVHRELQKKGVTLFLLWEEFKYANPDGYQYSWFCREYRLWRGKLDVVMRHTYSVKQKTCPMILSRVKRAMRGIRHLLG